MGQRPESDDEHTVHVGNGDTPDTPDKPDKPDTPDTPDKPGVGGMTITKTANKNEVSVGDVVSYTLSATVNSGKETAKNVVITDACTEGEVPYIRPEHIDKNGILRRSFPAELQ